MSRIFNRELSCGCLISSDGGGALMDCFTDDCKFNEWMKTKDYQEHLKEIEENN